MPSVLLKLLGVFAPLSFATVGGGKAVIADIQHQVVVGHHWMTQVQFMNAYGISRIAPGPGPLFVTLIGWHVAGFAGAVVATVGIFGPTAFLICGVARICRHPQGADWQVALQRGLRPVAVGMTFAALYVLFRSLDGGWPARLIALASSGALMATRVSPAILLAGGAIIFIALHMAHYI